MANLTPQTEHLKATYAKPKWNSGKTVVIRIPAKLKEQILAYAKALDEMAN